MDFLTDKQVIDYYEHRKKFLTWLFRIGKNPEKAKGYSPYTVAGTADRTARFDLWRWNNRGGYSIPPTQEDATAYMEKVAYDDVVEYHQQFKREVVANLSDGWTLTKSDLDEWRAEVVGDA